MSRTLLEQFLKDECTPYVRRLLEDALKATAPSSSTFEFNCFKITVNRAQSAVLIEDDLDATEAGLSRVPVSVFVAALRKGVVSGNGLQD
jgi:hypothetical protein